MDISITLNKDDAIHIGSEAYGQLHLDIPLDQLTPDERACLAATQGARISSLNMGLSYYDGAGDRQYRIFPPTVEGVYDRIRTEMAAALARKQADEARKQTDEREKRELYESVVIWLLGLDDAAFRKAVSQSYLRSPGARDCIDRCKIKDDPRLKPQCERYLEEQRQKKARQDEEQRQQELAKAEAKQQRQREEECKEAHREQQITDWVATRGTESQCERHAAHLLDRQEILQAMEAEAFALLLDIPLYEKLTQGDIEHTDDYCDGGAAYCVDDAPSVDAGTFDLMKKIGKQVPGATVVCRIHKAECTQCDGVATRLSVKVAITVGEFSFTREYAC